MKNIIEKMLYDYEKGSVSRRDFIQSVAMITATPALFAQHNKPILQGKTLNHVTLYVSDVARSKKFYQELLALPVKTEDNDYCDLSLGDSFLGIYKDEGSNPRSDHFCIGIESYDAQSVFEKLQKEFPGSKPTLENEDQVYFRDPDNIHVQLSAINYKRS